MPHKAELSAALQQFNFESLNVRARNLLCIRNYVYNTKPWKDSKLPIEWLFWINGVFKMLA